jgi:hypothetical protein
MVLARSEQPLAHGVVGRRRRDQWACVAWQMHESGWVRHWRHIGTCAGWVQPFCLVAVRVRMREGAGEMDNLVHMAC